MTKKCIVVTCYLAKYGYAFLCTHIGVDRHRVIYVGSEVCDICASG